MIIHLFSISILHLLLIWNYNKEKDVLGDGVSGWRMWLDKVDFSNRCYVSGEIFPDPKVGIRWERKRENRRLLVMSLFRQTWYYSQNWILIHLLYLHTYEL